MFFVAERATSDEFRQHRVLPEHKDITEKKKGGEKGGKIGDETEERDDEVITFSALYARPILLISADFFDWNTVRKLLPFSHSVSSLFVSFCLFLSSFVYFAGGGTNQSTTLHSRSARDAHEEEDARHVLSSSLIFYSFCFLPALWSVVL